MLTCFLVVGYHRNRTFGRTPRAVANTSRLLELPEIERHWKFILEKGRLKVSPLWKHISDPEGTLLPPTKYFVSWLLSGWSCQSLYGRSLLSKPLTAEENLCAEEIMSGKFKIPSYDEMMAKRKGKRAKGKEVVESPSMSKQKDSKISESEKEAKSSGMETSTKKRKALLDQSEDLDNVTLKITREAAVFTDPSGLSSFVEGLLLEGDEERLSTLGPVEAAKKAMVLNFQVSLTFCLFLFFFF